MVLETDDPLRQLLQDENYVNKELLRCRDVMGNIKTTEEQ